MTEGIEMIALNVGKGDATLIRTGDYTCLIDTGRYSARKNLMAALDILGVEKLDAVFLTHTHNDHSGGLRKLRKSGIPIGAIYASEYHPACKRKEHPAVKNAEKMDMKVGWLHAGMSIKLGTTGAVFDILAPVSENRDNENENSLVMMLHSNHGRILLTGDMEMKEEAELLQSKVNIACEILKVPDHGDSDACSRKLIKACGAKIAVISTNTEEKPKTPDAKLLCKLKEQGSECFVTQESPIGIRVRLLNHMAFAERITTTEKEEIFEYGN